MPSLLVWAVFGLLFCCSPLFASTDPAKVQPIRSIKIIDRDEAGLPLRFPAALAYDPLEDEIYITSPLKNKLVISTSDYFPYLSLGAGRGLSSISGCFLKDGMLYVCVGAGNEDPKPHIAIYDAAFLPQKKIYFPQLKGFSPLSLVVGATGKYYVVGLNGSGVVVLDADGNFERIIEPLDEVLGVKEKAAILALDVDSQGRLYFLSESLGRVYVYDKNEKFLYKFGEKGGEAGKLSRPRGLAVDEFRQQVYIVDYQRHAVAVYSINGEYQFEIGGLGQGRGWFYYPNDVIVDGKGRLLVADTFNHRVQVFEFVGAAPKFFGGAEEPVAGQPAQRGLAAPPTPEPEIVAIGHIDIDLPADAVGDFLVLTSITSDAQLAQELAERLRAKAYPVHVQPLDKGERGIWQQVLVGPYREPLEAQAVAERLRSEERLPAILKTRGAATELKILPEQPEPPAAVQPKSEQGAVEPAPGEAATDAAETSQSVPVEMATAVNDTQALPVRSLLDVSAALPSLDELSGAAAVTFKLPADQTHASMHALPLVLATSSAAVAGTSEEGGATAGNATERTAQVVISPVTRQPVSLPVASAARNRAAIQKADFCVKCHDQRIAKVCLQCHPRERRERL